MSILKKKTIEELKEDLEREKLKSQIRVEKQGIKTEIAELKGKGKGSSFFNGLKRVGKGVGKGMIATGKAAGKAIEKMPGVQGNMPGFGEDNSKKKQDKSNPFERGNTFGEETTNKKQSKSKKKEEFNPFGWGL